MRSGGHSAGCLQTHIPMQSAPPMVGLQLSVGSSWQVPLPGQGLPLKPPQLTWGTHSATGGQGAVTQTTGFTRQTVPAGQSAAAHGFGAVSGTQVGWGSQGALTHITSRSSQRCPIGHCTGAQPVEGGGLHSQVGHPLASFLLPWGQAMAVQTRGGQLGPASVVGVGIGVAASGGGGVGAPASLCPGTATHLSAQPQVPSVRAKQEATSPLAQVGRLAPAQVSHGVVVSDDPVPISLVFSPQATRVRPSRINPGRPGFRFVPGWKVMGILLCQGVRVVGGKNDRARGASGLCG